MHNCFKTIPGDRPVAQLYCFARAQAVSALGNCSERLVHFPHLPGFRRKTIENRIESPLTEAFCEVDFDFQTRNLWKELESPNPFSVIMKCRPSAGQLVRS